MAEDSVHEHAPKTDREEKVAAHARARALRENNRKHFMGNQARGFMDFVREQGVVGLAVGLAIGTAATVFVKSIVDGVIVPSIGALLPGSKGLVNQYYCFDLVNGECVNKLAWGAVISKFISFLAVAAVIYFVVKILKLDKLDKKKDVK